jgi:hypothetical protein
MASMPRIGKIAAMLITKIKRVLKLSRRAGVVFLEEDAWYDAPKENLTCYVFPEIV